VKKRVYNVKKVLKHVIYNKTMCPNHIHKFRNTHKIHGRDVLSII